VIEAPVTPPVVTSWKSVSSTPVTPSLKTASHSTEFAFVGVELPRSSETTIGAALSVGA
jgi:hypothetical protein